MNIAGILSLKEKSLPVMRNTFIFRNLSDIPEGYLDKYGDREKWAIRGFDDSMHINDNPYRIDDKDVRAHSVSKSTFMDRFNELNSKLDKLKVPLENRIYLICESFGSDDVNISGHVLRDRSRLDIDILEGNKPSRTDWTPKYAYKFPIVDNKIHFNPVNKYNEICSHIIEDVEPLPAGAYLDFTLFKDGYFFYHDYSITPRTL